MAYIKVLTNKFRIKRLRIIYILYWFLLTYIVAALVFWFIALNRQNKELSRYRLDMIDANDKYLLQKQAKIEDYKKRKTTQYISEGITFFLLIVAGAVFVFRLINRQLKQSQQQQHFLMAVTHELKTPIAVTKLNLETLQKRLLNAEQQQKLISTTIQETNRLNALCNNMLLTSQIEAGGYKIVKEKIDFVELVKEYANDFIARFPYRKIETQFTGRNFVTGDKMLLQLAVNNLLDNAIKYSGREDIVLLKVFTSNNMLKLQIIDEGSGITDAEKVRIFDKYFRGAGRQTKGTGLGLYLTKKIIQEHKGNINVTNNFPRGSVFEVSFTAQKL